MEGTAPGLQGPWPGDRAEPGRRRRGVEASGRRCGRSGTRSAGATVLGAQDGRTCSTSCPRARSRRRSGCSTSIYQAESRAEAEKAFDLFVATLRGEVPRRRSECLVKDRGVLLTFYVLESRSPALACCDSRRTMSGTFSSCARPGRDLLGHRPFQHLRLGVAAQGDDSGPRPVCDRPRPRDPPRKSLIGRKSYRGGPGNRATLGEDPQQERQEG